MKSESSARCEALRSAQVALARYKKPGECWSEEVIDERRREAIRELPLVDLDVSRGDLLEVLEAEHGHVSGDFALE